MSAYFSKKFKQLRKAGDLTQEDIAKIFHVSPQAVSRWETGANCPDAETLPHIAIFFKVTVDELLGTESIRGEENVKDLTKEIRNLLNSGKLDEAIATARKAVKKYPLNAGLHYHLVQGLNTANNKPENNGKFKDEIISISERIIGVADYESSLEHRVQLVRNYAQWGMLKDAKRILDTLPCEIWNTKEPWSGLVLEGDEWRENQRHRIVRAAMLLDYLLVGYSHDEDLDTLKKIECQKFTLVLDDMIHSISGTDKDTVNSACVKAKIAALYCEIGDIENALSYVEKATQDSMLHLDQMYKTNEDDGGNYMPLLTTRNLPWVLWEDYLMKPPFDIVRNDERFIKSLELLKSKSKELE